MNNLLSHVSRHLCAEIPNGLPTDLAVMYFPQLGFLIQAPLPSLGTPPIWESLETEEPWERMFSNDAFAYYKNSKMREMDDHFGDVYSDICGELLVY